MSLTLYLPESGPRRQTVECPDCSPRRRILRALREAGFDVYRPDSCETGELLLTPTSDGRFVSGVFPLPRLSFNHLPLRSRYRLVPVESPKENE